MSSLVKHCVAASIGGETVPVVPIAKPRRWRHLRKLLKRIRRSGRLLLYFFSHHASNPPATPPGRHAGSRETPQRRHHRRRPVRSRLEDYVLVYAKPVAGRLPSSLQLPFLSEQPSPRQSIPTKRQHLPSSSCSSSSSSSSCSFALPTPVVDLTPQRYSPVSRP